MPSATRFINDDPESEGNVTEGSVQQFTQSDTALPADRAAYVTQMTEAIGARLGGGREPETRSGEERFIHAVVMTGLLHLHTGDDSITVHQALTHRKQLENLSEQRTMIVAKRRSLAADAALRTQQTKLIKSRDQFIQAQTVELRQAVHKFEKKRNITPETIREIRGVYGLIAENVAQLNASPIVVEARPVPGDQADDDSEIQTVDLSGLVDPQTEIERQYTERAHRLMAAPEEEETNRDSGVGFRVSGPEPPTSNAEPRPETVASGEWQGASENPEQTSVVRGPLPLGENRPTVTDNEGPEATDEKERQPTDD